MGILEVALRNAINEQLAVHFNDPDWIIHQKRGFMADRRLRRYDPKRQRAIPNTYLRDLVTLAEQGIRRIQQLVTSGKVIAELPLGFWNSLFDKTEYKILQG